MVAADNPTRVDSDRIILKKNNILRVCTMSLSPSSNDLLLTFDIAQYMISLEIVVRGDCSICLCQISTYQDITLLVM